MRLSSRLWLGLLALLLGFVGVVSFLEWINGGERSVDTESQTLFGSPPDAGAVTAATDTFLERHSSASSRFRRRTQRLFPSGHRCRRVPRPETARQPVG